MAEIRCGIALHTGDIMYGNVGSTQRLDFTVMGTAVNGACRLETLCKVLAVPLIVSEAVALLYIRGRCNHSASTRFEVSVARLRSSPLVRL